MIILNKKIIPKDELAEGYSVKSRRHLSMSEKNPDLVSLRIIIKSTLEGKEVYHGVKVARGVGAEEIDEFKKFCLDALNKTYHWGHYEENGVRHGRSGPLYFENTLVKGVCYSNMRKHGYIYSRNFPEGCIAK